MVFKSTCLLKVSKVLEKSWTILFLSGSAFSLSNNVSGSAFFHLCNFSKLNLFLSQLSTQVLVHALVTFHLDYSLYAILSGLPKELPNWLQMVHNSAARIINCTKSTDHITHNLTQLHWLPIRQCIQYKILLLTFKVLNDLTTPASLRPSSSSHSFIYSAQPLHWLFHVSDLTPRVPEAFAEVRLVFGTQHRFTSISWTLTVSIAEHLPVQISISTIIMFVCFLMFYTQDFKFLLILLLLLISCCKVTLSVLKGAKKIIVTTTTKCTIWEVM